MRHRTSELLYSYWMEVRAGRLAPRRVDIEPSRIAAILPDTFIIEHVNPCTYRFRLAGTRLCERLGMELRGTGFLGLWSPGDQKIIQRQLTLIASTGAAGLFDTHATTTGDRATDGELIVLPLSNTAGEINRFMGAWSPLDAVQWYGSDYEVNHTVRGHTIVDPDRPSPLPGTQPAAEEPPAIKLYPQARTVQRDARRFRVFEGGLGTAPGDKR